MTPSRGEPPGLFRPSCVEVDLDAIEDNTRLVRRLIGPGRQLFAAVKANGYGFGLPEVAESMLAGGADAFALADLRDAACLREAGIESRILLYGGNLPTPGLVGALERYDLVVTVTDLEFARACAGLARAQLRVLAKVNVGLERLGTEAESAGGLVRELSRLPGLVLEGVYTHLHVPAGDTGEYVSWQLGRFEVLLEELEAEGIEVPLRMAESSAVLPLPRRARLNAIDPGHLLYGFVPPGPRDAPAGLRPAFRALKTRVVQTRVVSRPGFHERAPFPLRPGMRVGVIPLGRSDGLRALSCGEVLVRGRRVPIVGGFSLEHTRIDLTGVPECERGDEVVIIGRQGPGEIRLDEVMSMHDLDGVGVVLEVRESIRREYLRSGGVRPCIDASA